MNAKDEEILTREEMKYIMAGSSTGCTCTCCAWSNITYQNDHETVCDSEVAQCFGNNPHWIETVICNGSGYQYSGGNDWGGVCPTYWGAC